MFENLVELGRHPVLKQVKMWYFGKHYRPIKEGAMDAHHDIQVKPDKLSSMIAICKGLLLHRKPINVLTKCHCVKSYPAASQFKNQVQEHHVTHFTFSVYSKNYVTNLSNTSFLVSNVWIQMIHFKI